jgi:hypothetical protein
MATQKKPVSKTSGNPVNWSLQAHQRVMAVWHVAAMSLGVEPTLASIALAKMDKTFSASFEERKRVLGRKFSTEPATGHVTYFPRHEYNDTKTGASNRMVDVVSCIKILKPIYPDLLPPEFLALEATLEKVALPKQHSPVSGLVVMPGAVMAPVLEEKPKKPPTTRGASLDHHNLHVLLYAMACGGYGYTESMTSTEKVSIAKAIAADVPQACKSRYGLGHVTVGPILMGAAAAAYILTPAATVRRVFNMTALAVASAASRSR